jgi:hypothetical protein
MPTNTLFLESAQELDNEISLEIESKLKPKS